MAVLLWGLVAALVLSAPVTAAVVPIMGLGEDDEEQEEQKQVVAPAVVDSSDEALKQTLLFMPFRDESKYKGEWDIYSEVPRGLADSLKGSAFFRTFPIESMPSSGGTGRLSRQSAWPRSSIRPLRI